MLMLFAGDDYYPQGGFKDYIQSCATVLDCIQYHRNNCSFDYEGGWAHVFDTETMCYRAYCCKGVWEDRDVSLEAGQLLL